MTDTEDRPAQSIPSTDLRGNTEPGSEQTLRQRAEQIVCDTAAQSPEAITALSPQDLQRAFHELRVQQIELELQNEQLRRAQAENKAAQAGYLDLDGRAPVGYCTVSASGEIQEANFAAANPLGLAQGKLIGQPLSRFIVSEDQDVFDLFRRSLFEAPTQSGADSGPAGGPVGCTLRMRKPDGAVVWARLEAIAAMDADAAPICRVTLSDLTLGQQVEALQGRLQRAEIIIEDILDWQSWFGLDGRYLWVNPAVEQLTGYSPEEIMAMSDWVSVLIAEEDWPIFGETFRDAIRGSSGTGFEIRYVRKDGVKRWISMDWKPAVDAQGKLLGTRTSGRDITDLKLTEEALRRSQSMLARAETIAHIGSWEWDVATDAVTWSDELYRILQRDPAEGAPSFADYLKLSVHEDAQRLRDAQETALTLGMPYELELHAIRKDGATVLLLTVGHAYSDPEGRVARLVGFVQDVTKRRAAERALRESEQRFREMFMNAPLCILIHDADTGEILDANPAAAAMYGFDSVEALKANYQQLWLEPPPYSVDDARQWITKAVSEGPQRFEWRGLSVKGHVIWQLVYLRALVIEGKTRVLAMTVDTTREKQSNLDLQASEARARAIIDTAPAPFLIRDEENVLYLNQAFTELFGYTFEDIPTVADYWSRAYPDPEARRQRESFARRFLESAPRGGAIRAPAEAAVRCKDGQMRTVQTGASKLDQSFDGCYLLSFHDVTDIRAAQVKAEQAARAKSEFLANMSHEIRTPLNAMLGLAQLLEGEALSAEQRHLVKQMRGAGNALLALVNDILDLSKLAAGQLRLEVRTFSPAAVLAQVGSLLGQQARSKGLTFRIDMPPDLAEWLRGDPLRLEQILLNLVGNAVKFTEHGEVCIQVSQQDVDTQAVRLRLEVHDTGIGIAPEHLATLGTSFAQVDGSITRRFGGTGLGLAISKQLVERMGGSFGVESTLGIGSTFWCEMPFERASMNDAPPNEAAPAERPAGPRLSGVHCLVVDDSPLNQEVVERALRREGARATLVDDGQQALDRLRAQPRDVDAVLMDIQMPVMDGLTATRAIRWVLGLTELPVIAFSASVLAEQRQQAREAGVSDFLAKPVDLEDLVAVLRRWAAPQPAVALVAEPPVRASSLSPAAFPDIPGIDRDRAARMLDQDWSFFLRLAHQFAADYADAARQTQQDLARGEVLAASRRLHTLRGLAGNLGALELAQSVRLLETALNDPQADPAPALADFDAQLRVQLTALAPWLERAPSVPDADPDAPLDEARLTALCDALSGHDLAALELFEALQPALTRRDGQAATQSLAQLIQSLRFSEALARLTRQSKRSQDAHDGRPVG